MNFLMINSFLTEIKKDKEAKEMFSSIQKEAVDKLVKMN